MRAYRKLRTWTRKASVSHMAVRVPLGTTELYISGAKLGCGGRGVETKTTNERINKANIAFLSHALFKDLVILLCSEKQSHNCYPISV